MIKLVPVENTEDLKALCVQYGIEYSPYVHAYVRADTGPKAQCVFSIEGYRVELLAVEMQEDDPLIPELLIRAVGAYAANRSGYLFVVKKEVGQPINATLKMMGFEENESEYSGKVPMILKGHCCHDTKNNEK